METAHTEEFVKKQMFKWMTIGINIHHFPLLFSMTDKKEQVTFGTKNVKSKFEALFNSSKSWKAAFSDDAKELNDCVGQDYLDVEPPLAYRQERAERLPSLLPLPLERMNMPELRPWITNEIKHNYWAQGGKNQSIKFGKPEYRPTFWDKVEHIWKWENTKNFRNAKFPSEHGQLVNFLRGLVPLILEDFNIAPEDHVTPRMDVGLLRRKQIRNGVPRDQLVPDVTPPGSPEEQVDSDDDGGDNGNRGEVPSEEEVDREDTEDEDTDPEEQRRALARQRRAAAVERRAVEDDRRALVEDLFGNGDDEDSDGDEDQRNISINNNIEQDDDEATTNSLDDKTSPVRSPISSAPSTAPNSPQPGPSRQRTGPPGPRNSTRSGSESSVESGQIVPPRRVRRKTPEENNIPYQILTRSKSRNAGHT